MSGTINLAFTQQFDMDGDPLSGGLLNFYTAGTSTPQTPYQDTALTIAHPNPIVLDASGRVPMFYVADGFIKIRLTDKNGVVIIAADQLLVIGPSSGGSTGGTSGDVTRQFDTGDIKARYDNRSINGWVRCNGNTIGQTGASEPNGVGTGAQALYEYLYGFDSIKLAGGAVKSGNAVLDFATKNLILPDLRGRVIAGLDDMGALAGAAARLTAAGLGAGITGIVLGNAGGLEKLTSAQIVGHTHNLRSDVFHSGSLSVSAEQDFFGNAQEHTHGWGSLGLAGANGQIQNVTGRFQTYLPSQATPGVNQLDHVHPYTDQKFSPSNQTAAGGNPAGGSAGSDSTSTGFPSTSGYNLDHVHNIDVGGTTSGRSNGHYHRIGGTTENNNSAVTAQPNVPPTMVMNIYIKL